MYRGNPLYVWLVIATAPLIAIAWASAGDKVEPWTPKGVSSSLFESHAAFDPLTGDLYFVRSSREFLGWHILMSHCTSQGWSSPQAPTFAAAGLEADPYFAPDGSLYFISTRFTGSLQSKDLDIWHIERSRTGAFGKPVRLPEPINGPKAEWFPRPTADGWLYFGSDRQGGQGATDIWRARSANGHWMVENLGPAINTASDEYEAQPSPDGKTLIIMTNDGLYESRWDGRKWSQRVKLGPSVNVNGTEVGALFSPSGHSLLFSRNTKGPDSGEFFVFRRGGTREAWPPACTGLH